VDECVRCSGQTLSGFNIRKIAKIGYFLTVMKKIITTAKVEAIWFETLVSAKDKVTRCLKKLKKRTLADTKMRAQLT